MKNYIDIIKITKIYKKFKINGDNKMIQYGKEFFIRLTRRQQEVLKALVYLYIENKRPVSYKEIAQHLEISKWTAYDIMQEITKKGFVKIYFKPKKGPGRTEVLYIPKEDTIERIEEFEPSKTNAFVKRWISTRLKKLEHLSSENVIANLIGIIKNEKNPMSVVLNTTALIVVASKLTLTELTPNLNMGFVFAQNIYTPTLISFVAELNLTYLTKLECLSKMGIGLTNTIEEILNKFRENLFLISPASQKRIIEYLKTYYNNI